MSPFSSMVAKGHFSWDAFLNVLGCFPKRLEMSPFPWRQFCRCTFNSLGHAFPQTQNVFTNGAMIPTIYLACCFADPMFSLEKLFFAPCLSYICRALRRAKLHISLSHMCTRSKTGFSKFWHKSFGYSLKKSDKPCLLFSFSWMRESRTFERLSIFLEHPVDFDDFPEQIRYSWNSRQVQPCTPCSLSN